LIGSSDVSSHAHIIPRRAFVDDTAFDDFVGRIGKRRAECADTL